MLCPKNLHDLPSGVIKHSKVLVLHGRITNQLIPSVGRSPMSDGFLQIYSPYLGLVHHHKFNGNSRILKLMEVLYHIRPYFVGIFPKK